MTFSVMGSSGLARRGSAVLVIFLLLASALTGCLVRRREKIPAASPYAPIWKTATLQELLEQLKTQQDKIDTVDVTATIEPSISSPAKGEIVHYRDIRVFILIRKPGFIRMMGLYPVVQNKAFDMTSDGQTFRVYIPLKNRFIIGKNTETHRSESTIENLRPQVILQALLLEGPEPGKEEAVLENFSQGEISYYIVHIIRRLPGEAPVLARNIWFERRGLSVTRLVMFEDTGDEVTDVRYSNYGEFSDIAYPRDIVVDRPKDLYGLHLSITNLRFNQPITEDKFRLEQPPGTELKDLGKSLQRKKEIRG